MLSLAVSAVEDLLDDDGVSYDAIKFVGIEQMTNGNVNDETFLEDDVLAMTRFKEIFKK